jgi:hypothetical protein
VATEKPDLWYWKKMITETAKNTELSMNADLRINNQTKCDNRDATRVDTSAMARRKRRMEIEALGQENGGEPKRRMGITVSSSGHGSSISSGSLSGSSVTLSLEDAIRIKKEALDDTPIPEDSSPMVAVHIGPTNTKHLIRQFTLSESPYLTSLITLRPNNPQPFIMDPSLMNVNASDFEVVKTYLVTSQYKENYPDLRDCGRVYVMAHMFGLTKLKELVMKKITKGFRAYDAKGMLGLAGYVFGELKIVDGEGEEEPLKEWLINWIADKMRELSLRENRKFWDMLERNEELQVKVFVRKGEMVKGFLGAKVVVKVEEGEEGNGVNGGE